MGDIDQHQRQGSRPPFRSPEGTRHWRALIHFPTYLWVLDMRITMQTDHAACSLMQEFEKRREPGIESGGARS